MILMRCHQLLKIMSGMVARYHFVKGFALKNDDIGKYNSQQRSTCNEKLQL